jgi:hypothetical protein
MLAFAGMTYLLRLKARDFNHPREKQESQTRGAEILAARLVVILSSLGKTSDWSWLFGESSYSRRRFRIEELFWEG